MPWTLQAIDIEHVPSMYLLYLCFKLLMTSKLFLSVTCVTTRCILHSPSVHIAKFTKVQQPALKGLVSHISCRFKLSTTLKLLFLPKSDYTNENALYYKIYRYTEILPYASRNQWTLGS